MKQEVKYIMKSLETQISDETDVRKITIVSKVRDGNKSIENDLTNQLVLRKSTMSHQ